MSFTLLHWMLGTNQYQDIPSHHLPAPALTAWMRLKVKKGVLLLEEALAIATLPIEACAHHRAARNA